MGIKKIGLTTYGISIQDDQNQRKELHNILGTTLINIFEDYGNSNLQIYTNDDSDETVFSFDKIAKETVLNNNGQEVYDILYGRIKTGEYGIETELVNHLTGGVSYNRSEDEADVKPFGFAVLLPAGNIDNAIIVLQSLGIYGMKGELQKKLTICLKQIDNALKFEMGVIVPRVVLDRFFDHGVLQSIRLIRYNIPSDVAERYGINYNVKETVEERIIRRPLGFLENKRREISEWRNGARNYTDVIQIEDYAYDDLKMDFQFGKSTKTISLKNIDNLQICEDVTEQVILQGGNPEFDSLKRVMRETGEFYLRAKGLITE